jgi:hypothetical protein
MARASLVTGITPNGDTYPSEVRSALRLTGATGITLSFPADTVTLEDD